MSRSADERSRKRMCEERDEDERAPACYGNSGTRHEDDAATGRAESGTTRRVRERLRSAKSSGTVSLIWTRRLHEHELPTDGGAVSKDEAPACYGNSGTRNEYEGVRCARAAEPHRWSVGSGRMGAGCLWVNVWPKCGRTREEKMTRHTRGCAAVSAKALARASPADHVRRTRRERDKRTGVTNKQRITTEGATRDRKGSGHAQTAERHFGRRVNARRKRCVTLGNEKKGRT
ncbi:hypothetical protein DFH07DRAFT_777873 [Mycena maculata]|uniref:Uncharacterized protein n=1 Tax=Mycena maculata TaxID=230809 RepID=A0AAD7N2U1_9AGAR|nr:hypothetical protein DFH07DRAFT_777873 [Mycena maculata]